MKEVSVFQKLTAAAAAVAALTATNPALAASATSNFDVSIQVLSTCSISASNMSFSSITTGTTSNTDATSSLTVNCSSGTPYEISLGNGANYSNVRRMAWGASHVDYMLYSDSGRTAEWSTTNTKPGVGTGADHSLTVFGRSPSGQSVTNTGNYGDTIIATVTY